MKLVTKGLYINYVGGGGQECGFLWGHEIF